MKFELEPYHKNTPSHELFDDLKCVAQILNKDTVSISEYNQEGRFHSGTIIRRFGSWNKAIEQAGLSKGVVINISDEELFTNIEKIWMKIGRQPRRREMKRPLSEYSETPYIRKFGSWRKALERFIEYINQDKKEDEDELEIMVEPEPERQQGPKKRISKREISHRLRFKILLRDGFTCKKCGRSPLKNPGVELHVDHLVPWSKGGESIPENLETKCVQCNLGKGNAFDL